MLYKVTDLDGRNCVAPGAAFQYPLPRGGRPGAWTEPVIGPVVLCGNGYHLTAEPAQWWKGQHRLFLAEGRGPLAVEKGDKVAYGQVRLLCEVTPAWPLLPLFPTLRALLVVSWRRGHSSSDEWPAWADLSRANLSGANLSRADLLRANLSGADLSGADLSGANLSRANLSGATLSGANLWTADLSRADLSGANLWRANLSGANLSGANLWRANLRADLSGADLSRADLSRADLSGANLSGANLSGANLLGADLSGANLSGADLPDGFTPPTNAIRG